LPRASVGINPALAKDRQRTNSVIDRPRSAPWVGHCLPDTPTFGELCDTADDELTSTIPLIEQIRLGAVAACGWRGRLALIVGGAMFSRWFQMLIFGYWLDCLLEVFPL